MNLKYDIDCWAQICSKLKNQKISSLENWQEVGPSERPSKDDIGGPRKHPHGTARQQRANARMAWLHRAARARTRNNARMAVQQCRPHA